MKWVVGWLMVAQCCWGEAFALFEPPEGWKISDPKTPAKRRVIGFVDKAKSGFCPSIHLTQEKSHLSMDKYLEIARKNSLRQKRTWKHLGKLTTQAGEAELIEIGLTTAYGPVRLLQTILETDDMKVILTAGATKKGFGKKSLIIEKALRSLSLCDDLFSLIQDEKKRETLYAAWQKKRQGVEFQNFKHRVVGEHSDLGPVWQIHMLGL